jgi:hypothetical protein
MRGVREEQAMVRATLLAPELEGLSGLSAAELTDRLKEYIDGGGGLVTPSEVEVARECVRRARCAEGASARAGRLEGLADLDAGRLEARLRAYFEAAGPQATQGEVALGQEGGEAPTAAGRAGRRWPEGRMRNEGATTPELPRRTRQSFPFLAASRAFLAAARSGWSSSALR